MPGEIVKVIPQKEQYEPLPILFVKKGGSGSGPQLPEQGMAPSAVLEIDDQVPCGCGERRRQFHRRTIDSRRFREPWIIAEKPGIVAAGKERKGGRGVLLPQE